MKYNISIELTKEEFNKLQHIYEKCNKEMKFISFSQFLDYYFSTHSKRLVLDYMSKLWGV